MSIPLSCQKYRVRDVPVTALKMAELESWFCCCWLVGWWSVVSCGHEIAAEAHVIEPEFQEEGQVREAMPRPGKLELSE